MATTSERNNDTFNPAKDLGRGMKPVGSTNAESDVSSNQSKGTQDAEDTHAPNVPVEARKYELHHTLIGEHSQLGTMEATDQTVRVLELRLPDDDVVLEEPHEAAEYDFTGFKVEGRPIIEVLPENDPSPPRQSPKEYIDEPPELPAIKSLYDLAKEKGELGESDKGKESDEADIHHIAEVLVEKGEIPVTQIDLAEETL